MNGIDQFIKNLVFVAMMVGAAATLVETTGFVGLEAAKAHQHAAMSFRWLNQNLLRI